MQHEQISFFDSLAAPLEEAAPAPVQVEAVAVPVNIQASAKHADTSGYRVFGIVRSSIVPAVWRPSARDVLELFPLSLSYYMDHGLLDRGDVIDLFAHELDADGNRLNMLADAHVTITGGELMDAVESL